MSENVKRVGRDLIYRGAIIEVYQDHMEFANGNKADWDYIHHDGAAAVVPVLEDGRILMVRQYRTALGREALEIPAGKLDGADEEGIVCAARELEEETGYRCENLVQPRAQTRISGRLLFCRTNHRNSSPSILVCPYCSRK